MNNNYIQQQNVFIPQQQQNAYIPQDIYIPQQQSNAFTQKKRLFYDEENDFCGQDLYIQNNNPIMVQPLITTYLKLLLSKTTEHK